MYLGTLAADLGCFPFDHETYLPQSDSRSFQHGIRSLMIFGTLRRARGCSVLYLHMDRNEASPKAISGRTSYLRVRLEFLPYPQLMPTLFNGCGFDPPSPITVTSIWSWVGHPVSGLRLPTMALLTLGFPTAPDLGSLTLPVSAARRTVLQKVRGYKGMHSIHLPRHEDLFEHPFVHAAHAPKVLSSESLYPDSGDL
jgi:hypothetical protein